MRNCIIFYNRKFRGRNLPLDLVDWRFNSVLENPEFSSSFYSAILRIGFILSKIARTILGITSRHNNVQSEKGNLERRLRALSLESNSFGS